MAESPVYEEFDATKRGDTEPIPLIQTPAPSWQLMAELEFIERAIASLRIRYKVARETFLHQVAAEKEAHAVYERERDRLINAMDTWDAAFASREKANIAFTEAYRRELGKQESTEPPTETDEERFARYSEALYGEG